MATILNLLKGTQKILPVALRKGKGGDGRNAPLLPRQIKITEITRKRLKEFKATITPSGFYPKRGNSERLRRQGITFPEMYTSIIVFRNSSGPNPATNAPSSTEDRARVRCNCAAYFFWFVQANHQHQSQEGTRGPKYKRATPPPPEGYPETNPNMIPGVCKHLVYFIEILKKRGFIV